MEKRDIRTLSQEELIAYFAERGEKPFRARQVYEWLWNKNASSFVEITSLSKTLREAMETDFTIRKIEVDRMQRSGDGTIKNAVRLHDGLFVESVLIPSENRTTACVSSQVGCNAGCKFCATASLKRSRNLTAGEIVDQVAVIDKESRLYFDRPLSNIVFMGMGEPLMNYTEVMRAIAIITDEKGLGMSARRITLSSVGLPSMIRRLADQEVKFNLAVSLHSAIDAKRSQIMPINELNPLSEIKSALLYWYSKTKNPVTFEYVIWEGINDTDQDILALVRLCRNVPSKVNLIQYNKIDGGEFTPAPQEVVERYIRVLEESRIPVRVRHSRGSDIDAACGQLANKVSEK